MQCDVINAVLTFARWENYHVRTVNNAGYAHSVVLARVPIAGKNLWLVTDPFSGNNLIGPFEKLEGCPFVSQVGKVLGKHIRKLETKGQWKKGKSNWDFAKNFMQYQRGNGE